MKAKFLLPLIILSFKGYCQETSVFIGRWQYFDCNYIYHEIVIEQHLGYIIGDSAEPAAVKLSLSGIDLNSTILGKWTFLEKTKKHISVSVGNDSISLYPLLYEDDNVKAFYQWYNNPTKTGNGWEIFREYFEKRKLNLIKKIKNGL